MSGQKNKIAVVGHFTYFQNHFPEGWENDANVLCIDVKEWDYSWLLTVYNFRPSVTLFFRPELYPAHYLRFIPGIRVALLSEPLPQLKDDKLEFTDETRLRLQVYASMAWDAFHWRIFYDRGKKGSADKLGFPIDEYRPLPIDTSSFYNASKLRRKSLDITFIGKPTPHRISQLDFLRSSGFEFLWVAHGLSGKLLAEMFRRSKVVLNVHADGCEAFEPRLYLAAACGAGVLTEPLSSRPEFFVKRIFEHRSPWDEGLLVECLHQMELVSDIGEFNADLTRLSTRRLIDDIFRRFSVEIGNDV